MKNNFKKLGIKLLSMSLAGVSLFGAINSAQAMRKKKGPSIESVEKQNSSNSVITEVRVEASFPACWVKTIYQNGFGRSKQFLSSSLNDWSSQLDLALSYAASQAVGFPDAKFVFIPSTDSSLEYPLVRPGICIKLPGVLARLESDCKTITYYCINRIEKRQVICSNLILVSNLLRNAVRLSPSELKTLEYFDVLMEEKKRREIRAEEIAREAEEQRRQEELAKLEAEERMEEQKRREAKALGKEAKKKSSAVYKESKSSDSSSSSASCEEETETEAPLTDEKLLAMCDKKAAEEFNLLSPQQKKQALKTVSKIIANPTNFKKIRSGAWESIGAREADINRHDRIIYVVTGDNLILIKDIGGHLLDKK